MKQFSRTLLTGYLSRALPTALSNKSERSRALIPSWCPSIFVNVRADLLETKLPEVSSKVFLYQRSRVRPIPKRCFNGRSSRDL